MYLAYKLTRKGPISSSNGCKERSFKNGRNWASIIRLHRDCCTYLAGNQISLDTKNDTANKTKVTLQALVRLVYTMHFAACREGE